MPVLIFLAQWLLLPTGSSSQYPKSCSLCSPLDGDPPLEHQSSLWHRSPSGHGCLSVLYTVMLNNKWPAYPKLPRLPPSLACSLPSHREGTDAEQSQPCCTVLMGTVSGECGQGLSLSLPDQASPKEQWQPWKYIVPSLFPHFPGNTLTSFISLHGALWPYTLRPLLLGPLAPRVCLPPTGIIALSIPPGPAEERTKHTGFGLREPWVQILIPPLISWESSDKWFHLL